MKKIYYNIVLPLLLLSTLGGCSDPHQYNEEADKSCEVKLQSSSNLNELLLYALESDASPSTIKKILKKGASPKLTIGKEDLPAICFAKSPKAISILYEAHPKNKEKHGPGEIIFNNTRQIPLFHYQSPELCQAYLESILENVDYGEYELNLRGESKKISLTKERVLNHILTQKDKHDRNALFYAKNKEMVDYWLSMGYNLNTSDKYGNNVLSYCIGSDETCNIEFIEYLIEKGADVNFGEKERNMTPLGKALFFSRNDDIINLLISKGAKVENIETTSNLYYCVQNPKQVEFLKEKGISPNIITPNGFYVSVKGVKYTAQTPLANAVGRNLSLDTIKAFIDAGAETDKAFFTLDNKKLSALNISVSVLRNDKLTELLLAHGAAKSFDAGNVLTYLVQKKDAKAVSRLIELGVKPTQANQDEIFNLFLGKNDISNLKKMIDGGYDINKKSLTDYTSTSFFENEKLEDKQKKFNAIIELGYDVNRRDKNGDYLLDNIMNEFLDINIKNISINAFEKIIKNTSALKDKGYATHNLKGMLDIKNLRPEILDIFLENCPSLDRNILRSTLINIFEFKSSVPESAIISLIKHIDDLNDKINNKTMIGYALEYQNVSLDIIKAISEKMYFPTARTNYKYYENVKPIDIAKKLGRNDIVVEFSKNIYFIDKDNNINFYGIQLGMSEEEILRRMKFLNRDAFPKEEYIRGLSYILLATPKFDKNDKLVYISILDCSNTNVIKKIACEKFKPLSIEEIDYISIDKSDFIEKTLRLLKYDNFLIGDYIDSSRLFFICKKEYQSSILTREEICISKNPLYITSKMLESLYKLLSTRYGDNSTVTKIIKECKENPKDSYNILIKYKEFLKIKPREQP